MTKMNKEFIVYRYRNLTNGKSYIGQTGTTMKKRAGKNGYGYKHCVKFYSAIQKYGWDNFEATILCKCNQWNVDELERFYIQKFDSINNGYNLCLGGQDIHVVSDETKQRMSEAKKGKPEKWNEIFKNNFYKKGQKPKNYFDKSINEKISKSLIGNKNCLGNTHSKETKEKIMKSQPNLKIYNIYDINMNLLISMNSSTEVAKYVGRASNKNISRDIKNKSLVMGKYYIEYATMGE